MNLSRLVGNVKSAVIGQYVSIFVMKNGSAYSCGCVPGTASVMRSVLLQQFGAVRSVAGFGSQVFLLCNERDLVVIGL